MKMFRTVFLFLMSLFAGHLLFAQEIISPDSTVIQFKEKPLPFGYPKQSFLLPDAPKMSLEPFKSSDEFKGVPFQPPGYFPKTWMEFKHAFMALPLPEEFALMERLHRNMERGKLYYSPLWLDSDEIIRNNTRYRSPIAPGVTICGGSLIGALYDEFSHEGKMRRKYDSIIAQDKIKQQVSKKYDVELVKAVTGFDDATAQEFMDFCIFKNDSIIQSKQYDVYIMIYDCLSQFILAEQE